MWVTWPSWTKTCWPHPTAQYGQTDLTILSAMAVRGLSRWLAALLAAAPRPSRSGPVSCR